MVRWESGAGRLDAFGVAVLGGHLDAVAAADGADEVGAQRQDLVDPDVHADHGPVLGAETVALGGPADGPRCVRIRDDLGEEFTLDQLVDGVLGRCAGDSRPVGDLGEGEAPGDPSSWGSAASAWITRRAATVVERLNGGPYQCCGEPSCIELFSNPLTPCRSGATILLLSKY
ncbi:hypothetical protein [Streptomyces rhizosphaericus]|uniref:Uncharacterized protein n=1 Tax=Streptomyces rhizosphaericus TaxID=114699 RepID=A0A6G4AKC3_9ACTN|nr:hypothetical protein [Streptomyces rhizosphaericus]NEW73698.1 hypothetical protein [Streptomyces rhizosphaericus]